MQLVPSILFLPRSLPLGCSSGRGSLLRPPLGKLDRAAGQKAHSPPPGRESWPGSQETGFPRSPLMWGRGLGSLFLSVPPCPLEPHLAAHFMGACGLKGPVVTRGDRDRMGGGRCVFPALRPAAAFPCRKQSASSDPAGQVLWVVLGSSPLTPD